MNAVIVGCGAGWEQHQNFSGDIFAVNRAGLWLDHVDHWVSENGYLLREWSAMRCDPTVRLHSTMQLKRIHYVWPQRLHPRGTSGLLALRIAVWMGYSVTLCGVGLVDAQGKRIYCDPIYEEWEKWIRQNPWASVRSVSGLTAEWFG